MVTIQRAQSGTSGTASGVARARASSHDFLSAGRLAHVVSNANGTSMSRTFTMLNYTSTLYYYHMHWITVCGLFQATRVQADLLGWMAWRSGQRSGCPPI